VNTTFQLSLDVGNFENFQVSLPGTAWNVRDLSVKCSELGGEYRILDYREGHHNGLNLQKKKPLKAADLGYSHKP
jgi:hypothetical protein